MQSIYAADDDLSASPSSTGFARYLAQLLCVQKGYTTDDVPELSELASACDLLLVKADGATFQVACIVDAETDARKQFAFDAASLRAIMKECRAKYCGRLSQSKLPATLEIFEVRRRPLRGLIPANARSTPCHPVIKVPSSRRAFMKD